MRRVNLDPHAAYVGNRPPLLSRSERNRRALNGIPMDAPGPLIRRQDQRRPLIDIGEGSSPRGAAEAAEDIRRQAILAEKERSRAEHEAKLAEASAPEPKPKLKPAAKTKKPKRKRHG